MSQDVLSVEEFLAFVATARSGERSNQDAQVVAVLGRPVAHSKSPQLHLAAARAVGMEHFNYVRVEAGDYAELARLVKHSPQHVVGFSVTMPGKTAALEVADCISDRARRIGAANTLVRQADGQWLADNTDVIGVQRCLESLHAKDCHFARTSAIIVGNGGTARPAVAALAAQQVNTVTVVARSDRALQLEPLITSYGMNFEWVTFEESGLAKKCQNASVLVNTVPADIAAQYATVFTTAGSIIDVIYDPYPTALMNTAYAARRPVSDGLQMLVGQAESQFAYFTSIEAPVGVMLEAVKAR